MVRGRRLLVVLMLFLILWQLHGFIAGRPDEVCEGELAKSAACQYSHMYRLILLFIGGGILALVYMLLEVTTQVARPVVGGPPQRVMV
mmetsp:Transcript_23418/g.61306  ORF Transcript_23418/g.61306 Transcript_23418/m.61306 type:complete len:88 (+) Transcript_23418:71-334(+)